MEVQASDRRVEEGSRGNSEVAQSFPVMQHYDAEDLAKGTITAFIVFGSGVIGGLLQT